MDGLLGDFLDESDQLLTQLNDNLLRLDEWVRSMDGEPREACDAELLNEMFRAAHSIKGLSAMLGLTDINTLTHKIENVFDAARSHQLAVNGDVVDLVFLGIDQLTALVELLKDPSGEPVDSSEVIERIRGLLESAGAERKQSSQADAERALSGAAAEPATEPAAQSAAPDPFADLRDEENIPQKYLSLFIDETDVALDELSETLLALEEGGEPEQLKRLLVTSHRIKGSAASIGLNRAARLAHLMEDLLQNLTEAGGALSSPATDALLACTDALRQYLETLKKGVPEPDGFAEAAARLLASASAAAAAIPPELPEGAEVFAGEVRFEADLPSAGMKATLIHQKLARLGEVGWCDPPEEKLDEIEQLECFRFQVTSCQPREKVAAQLRVAGVREATLEPLARPAETPPAESAPATPGEPEAGPTGVKAPADPAPSAKKAAAAETSVRPTETVRVDIERLDELMNLAGQLVINKAQFTRIGQRLQEALGGKQLVQSVDRALGELEKVSGSGELHVDGLHAQGQMQSFHAQAGRVRDELEVVRQEAHAVGQARNAVKDLLETIHQFDRVSDAVQQAVMDTRMVPIGPLFSRFNRVVRDIARDTGKEIRLEIQGEKTELDKRMIDELSDPLIHMVRNSADHGIESPEVRQQAGKPRQGTVRLDACHRGNSIVIQVGDDGKGLDTERILRKCLEKGILTEADAEKMTPRQLYQMIWVPGMSTAEKITGVSGRGMGMDIVKSKIENLNGTVDIESSPGQGTTMTIKLPLTLAILPSLLVDIGGSVFALPMESVTEIVSVGRDRVSTVHGRQMVTLRGRVVSMIALGEILRFGRPARQDSSTRETTLVIVGEEGRELGLAVDRVLGEEDIVIKSIAENYKNVPGITGASILGDGRVALILDVPTLSEMIAKANVS